MTMILGFFSRFFCRPTTSSRSAILSFCALGALGALTALSSHRAVADDSFLPTWKLLKQQERHQFIAGYMFGWGDAAKVTDVAIQYVKENPSSTVEGLNKIRSLYDFNGLKADLIVRQLDIFFNQAENKDATLSQAITAVRSQLGR